MPSDDAKLTSLRDGVQIATSALFALTSGCYVAGLLIVNLRLAHFGVHSQQFNRTEYVLVGAVFALLAVGARFALAWTFQLIKFAVEHWKNKRRGRALWGFIEAWVAVLVPVYGLYVLSGVTLKINNWILWASIIVLAIFGDQVGKLVSALVALWSSYSSVAEGNRKIHPPTIVNLFQGLIALVSLVGFYALFTYPNILTSYGGGLRGPAMLVATKRGAEVAALLHLSMTQAGEIGPVYLLTESPDEIVVTREPSTGWSSPGAAVKLRRELIDSVETTGETTSKTIPGTPENPKPAQSAPPSSPVAKDAAKNESVPKAKPVESSEGKDAGTTRKGD